MFLKLSFLTKEKLYLAGGTALALQLGHRKSIDFDFYSTTHFTKKTFLPLFKKNLKNKAIKILRDFDNTFEIIINKKIHLSCFYYPYKIFSYVKCKGINLVSIEDIAAMKLVAISQRGRRRDFVDMYYLIKRFGLEKILKLTEKNIQNLMFIAAYAV
ncbi:MAG: nucleotidyl transferase AbiEii/AbiGii toxin family protein [Patescibacteria group bacterium]